MRRDLPERSLKEQKHIAAVADMLREASEDKASHIILFGSFARGDWVYDITQYNNGQYIYASDLDFLVVTKAKKYGKGSSGQRFESHLNDTLKFYKDRLKHTPNVIVEAYEDLNKRLEQKHYFYTDIVNEGVLFYEAEDYPLSGPRDLDVAERREVAQEHYDVWFDKSRLFLKDSQRQLDDNENNQSAFYLHQAAENLLTCAVLVLTDERPKTHDLAKLWNRCKGRDNAFTEIFNLGDPWQANCFKLLRDAYIEARYKKEYSIEADQLRYLIDRVTVLRDVTDRVCKDYIAGLGAD
ncbi:HEPN domain-containing protein [Amylibacter sp. SFDW26]|uniref:HEPN domain-containing protein n=1 Tax=Amylibacter sp. SFDW26 TaxID=2652722 RepID=UPI00126174CF|nr:HEPN domain-containing protein [Amylibacter sp. SFDW26]KAB7616160.1 HEPN domain-containing protein [Amylibacter sp. SFDW26]